MLANGRLTADNSRRSTGCHHSTDRQGGQTGDGRGIPGCGVPSSRRRYYVVIMSPSYIKNVQYTVAWNKAKKKRNIKIHKTRPKQGKKRKKKKTNKKQAETK